VRIRHEIDELETRYAIALGGVVEAFTWPSDAPKPDNFNSYGTTSIDDVDYGEDVLGEVAVLERTSMGGARFMVRDVARLKNRLPICWLKVTSGVATLKQARKVADACEFLSQEQCQVVDDEVGSALGVVGPGRLNNLIKAAVIMADPEATRRRRKWAKRYVRVGGDPVDTGTGWISAKLDRCDTICYDAHIHRIADKLAEDGDTGSEEDRLVKAAAMMCNPGKAVQYIGVPTTRGMNPEPGTDEEKQAFQQQVAKVAPHLVPRTQVYLHVHAETLGDMEAIARFHILGPTLISQVADITKGSSIHVTPVIHLNDNREPAVDNYEIPLRIREQVLLTDQYSKFPWSSVPSQNLDLDHVQPWQPGTTGLTRPSNLTPLERRAHRLKTHADWKLEHPQPGVDIWHTPAGQQFRVDKTGTHPIRE